MAQFASAAFTGTAFATLQTADTNFSKQTGWTQDAILGSTGAYLINNSGTTTSIYQHSGTPASADYTVAADIAQLGSGGTTWNVGVCGRMAAAADTFYFVIHTPGTGIRLFKRVAGTQTQLGSTYSYTLTTTPAQLRLRLSGSSISAELNGSTVIGPVTDTDITAAGKAGVYVFNMRTTGVADTASLDNFSADDIGASGPTINTQPSNQSVTTPATATFTVSATASSGSLSYQWQRSTNSGSSWANVSTGTGGTTASYTTAATSVSGGNANNADQFRVVVTDSAGSVNSSAATLTVAAAAAGLTSSPLKDNTGTLHLSAPFEAFVLNATTGALVVRKTSLTSHASTGVVTFTDAALSAATQYRVVWRRTDTGAQGLELLTAA